MPAAAVEELVSSLELSEWSAFERVEGPIGLERADAQAALVATVIANSNRSKESRAFEVKDFMPEWDQGEREPLTPEEQRAAVMAAMGAAPTAKRELLGPDGKPVKK